MTVAVLGSGSGSPGETMYDAMKEVGRLLATSGRIVASGGYGGSGMEAGIAGAIEAGGEVVGYGMFALPPNRFFAGQTFWDMGERRLISATDATTENCFTPGAEQQFGLRLGSLLEANGFVIDANGQIGTIVELAAVINLNLKVWPKRYGRTKPVAILHPSTIPLGVGSGLLDVLSAFGLCPRRGAMPFLGVFETPETAVNWVNIQIGD